MKLSTFVLLSTTARVLAEPLRRDAQSSLLTPEHAADTAVREAIETFTDPVEAVLAVHPHLAHELAEPRLLSVDGVADWMTEGDKLRLRKARKGFIDYTEHGVPPVLKEGDRMTAHTPHLKHQAHIRPLLSQVHLGNLETILHQLSTFFFNRYYKSPHGVQSAHYIHRHLAKIVELYTERNDYSKVSVGWHTHNFAQSSVVARFEPPVMNASAPLTIISAHQDSINYDSPMLRAPGANDDGSGTVALLEAFRVLIANGYVPERGPVEFHFYAGEEGGCLGSQDRARYTKDLGLTVGAMLQYDIVGWDLRRNDSIYEHIGLITYETDVELTNWIAKLAEEYLSVPARLHLVGGRGISDHVSWHNLGFPAACGDEADHRYAGDFIGMHTEHDTVDATGPDGRFSFEHVAKFSELAIAFVVEQAGWGAYLEPHDGY